MKVEADAKAYDDINITPMLDLAYVLLVIFIIMTTASVQGIKVDLPKASDTPSLAKPKTKAITVTNEGKFFLDTVPVTLVSIGVAAYPRDGSDQNELSFDDLDDKRSAPPPSDDEPPASSQRSRIAGTMDEALARAAEQIQLEEGREVPLKTPPPESGPQAALPAGIHAPVIELW